MNGSCLEIVCLLCHCLSLQNLNLTAMRKMVDQIDLSNDTAYFTPFYTTTTLPCRKI